VFDEQRTDFLEQVITGKEDNDDRKYIEMTIL